jgi:hypothetical protein
MTITDLRAAKNVGTLVGPSLNEREWAIQRKPRLSSLGAQPPKRDVSAMREEADLPESRTDVAE